MEIETAIVSAMSWAISDTKKIAQREHIKAITRHERVGLFTTRLRSLLIRYLHGCDGLSQLQTKKLVEHISDKKYWLDIGVLDVSKNNLDLYAPISYGLWTNNSDRRQILNAKDFEYYVEMANQDALKKADDDVIANGFKELEIQLLSMYTLNRLAHRLEVSSQEILTNLRSLALEMDESHAFV